MPKVSVIIPTYNRAEFLRSAIRSVLDQSVQDFEIVIVDDGSKDNTEEIVRSFNDKRIKYIHHETNKGAAGSRNTGLMHSNGEYIAFLDDDDEWLPEKLKMGVDLLENSPPKIGGVYSGFFKVDRTNGRVLVQITPTKRGDIFHDMFIENWVGTSSIVLLRKGCFEKVGLFDEGIVFGEDYDMWIRISKEFHFEYIKTPLVRYYIHGNRLSTNLGMQIRGYETVSKKYEQFFVLNKKSYSRRYLVLGVFYCYHKDIKKGREAFLKAIRLYPFDIRCYYNLGLSLLGADNFRKLKEIKERLFSHLTYSKI